MKRLLSFSLTLLFIFCAAFAVTAQEGDTMTELSANGFDVNTPKTAEDFALRDPCVLEHNGVYYVYGTGAARGRGYGCYASTDLVNWYGPVNVFTAPDDFDGTECFWAPECHYYNGSFYLFATYKSAATGHRGVSVFKAAAPYGPFEEISDGHVTPKDWDSIDGTLYMEDGKPYMVFVHEWTSMEDEVGDMSYAPMSDDLTRLTGEPVSMFKADSAPWTDSHVTDGPYLFRTESGRLVMLWSNFNKKGYAVGTVFSTNGKLSGKWRHNATPLYQKQGKDGLEGGHGMLFHATDGRWLLSIHSPNGGAPERIKFLEVEEYRGNVVLKDGNQTLRRVTLWFEDVFYGFIDKLLSK